MVSEQVDMSQVYIVCDRVDKSLVIQYWASESTDARCISIASESIGVICISIASTLVDRCYVYIKREQLGR